MAMKSISALVFYVKDLATTTDFYKRLGFTVTGESDSKLSVRMNWFTMDFLAADKESKEEFQAEATTEPKGAGLYIYISVDDVDEHYQRLLDNGFKPSSEPRDWPWGNREFVLRDPDGYKLVFFKKK